MFVVTCITLIYSKVITTKAYALLIVPLNLEHKYDYEQQVGVPETHVRHVMVGLMDE